MAEPQMFDIPALEMDEIISCFHEGMLGDIATNILPEHIKTPTPPIMMQICTSILSKFGVDVSSLCQARLNSSMEMKHAEMYMNTYKIVHVVLMINKLVPTLGKEITVTDLTTPRPKRVRKFISACINFFKAWDNNLKVWEEKHSPSVAAEVQNRELKEVIANNEKELAELQSWNEDQMTRRQELTDKQEKLQQDIHLLHKRKEEKELLKAEAKTNFQDITAALEKKQKQIDALKKEKENLAAQVVSSPKRHLETKHQLMQKMKVWEEKQAEAQGKAREAERVISQMGTMQQLVTDASQTAKENVSLKENTRKIENEKQSQSYEMENHRLTILEDTQHITNLKQQIVGLRDKMSRMNMRAKQRTTEYDSTTEALEREKNTLESLSGEIQKEIQAEEAVIKSLQNECEKKRSENKKICADLENKKQTIMKEMDEYMRIMEEKVNNSEVAKIIAGNSTQH